MSTQTSGLGSVVWFCCSAMLVIAPACATEDSSPPAAAGSGGVGGSGAAGSGGRRSPTGGAPQLGAACTSDGDCTGGYKCDVEMTTSVTVPRAPEGKVDNTLFPGGSCTPVALATFDAMGSRSCDPRLPRGSQRCTDEGVCSIETVRGETKVGCRKACEPKANESGCDRPGYTCDFVDHACIEGCRSDTECRILLIDANGDGEPDMVDYDSESEQTCDDKTGRCIHASGPQADGQSCSRDEDCSDDGLCIPPNAAPAGQRFPGGYCTRRGCEVEGRECDSGTFCESLRPWLGESETEPLCFARCKIGAEEESLRLGKSGHGEGCRTGFRCHYNGGVGAASGVCVGGVYNDVKTNNVGAACKTNDECYSPYGLGYCLAYALSGNVQTPGICTIMDCGAPGIPKDVCGLGNECVSQDSDQSTCLHNCKAATECPTGFACTDDDGEKATPKTCFPLCLTAADCRMNERCQPLPSSTSGAGTCVLQ